MKRGLLLVNIVAIVSLLSGSYLWTVVISASGGYASHYEFRVMALLPLSAALMNIIFMALLYKRIKYSEAGLLFLTHIGCLVLWSLSEFMQRISSDVGVADLWRNTALFGWAFMCIPYFLFVLSYIEKQVYARKYLLIIGFFAVFSGLVLAEFHSNLLISNEYVLKPWGYDSDNNGIMNIFGAWNMLVFITAATFLVKEYKITLSKEKRTQIKIFLFSLSIPLIGGTTTDLLLPNVFGLEVWPMAAFLVGTAGVILAYAIFKYGLFNLNPASLSSEIIATLPQPVLGTNKDFEVQFLNTSAEKMFAQYMPFRGKKIVDLFGKENNRIIREKLSEGLNQDGVAIVDRVPLGLKNGVVITQANIRRVTGSDKEGYIIGLSDVTQQVLTMKIIEKEVKLRTELYNQERARLLASVNGLRQGFLIVDSEQKISLINEKAQSMFPNIKVSSVQSGHVVDSSKISDINNYLKDIELDKKLEEAIARNKYVTSKDVDFGDMILDVEITPIVVGEDSIGAVVLLDDVTESKMIDRSKDEFFSIASHELRTPLTAIRGNTSMLLEYYKDDVKGDMKEMIMDILGSSQRLIEIVNDFLDTSRLEQGRMQFNIQNTDLNDLIQSVAKDTSIVAEANNDDVKVDPAIAKLPKVYADPDKLKQVIYNLLGNAIKFTENGKIRISGEVEGNFVRVAVVDQGRGISEQSKKLLFRKFQQASSSILTRDTTKGTGLGLYISKMIIENMGGSIRLDSTEEGKGSVFSFAIPLSVESDSEEKSQKSTIEEK